MVSNMSSSCGVNEIARWVFNVMPWIIKNMTGAQGPLC